MDNLFTGVGIEEYDVIFCTVFAQLFDHSLSKRITVGFRASLVGTI